MNIEKIREALQDAKQRIEDMLSSIDTGIYESELADAESDIDEALAELDKVQQPGKVLTEKCYICGKQTYNGQDSERPLRPSDEQGGDSA